VYINGGTMLLLSDVYQFVNVIYKIYASLFPDVVL